MEQIMKWVGETIGDNTGMIPVSILRLDQAEEYRMGVGMWRLLGFCDGESEWMMVGKYKEWYGRWILAEIVAIPREEATFV